MYSYSLFEENTGIRQIGQLDIKTNVQYSTGRLQFAREPHLAEALSHNKHQSANAAS
jgi:hypothetical protein